MGLPASKEPDTQSAPSTSSPPETERTPRVALVAAANSTAAGLKPSLERAGYEVLALEGAEPLFAAFEESAPDLVLVDAALGGESPFELCGEIRTTEVGRFMPLVLLSTVAVAERSIAEGLMAGADDYCLPCERPAEFMARVRVQLRNKRIRDRLRRVRNERDHYRAVSKVDPLTGLLNRGSFDSLLSEAMTGDSKFAVLFIDVDHFKAINDRLGHDTGDEVLRRVAQCIGKSARGHDHCGRYGGEEFVVFVAGADEQIAPAVGERHRANIEALDVPGLRKPVTVSVGVAVFDPLQPDLTRESLYRRADAALYRAKAEGRNRVVAGLPIGGSNVVELTASTLRTVPESCAPVEPEATVRPSAPSPPPVPEPAPLVAPPIPPPAAAPQPVVVDSPQAAKPAPNLKPGVASTKEAPRDSADIEAQLLRAMSRRAGLPLLPEAAQQALRLARDPASDMPRIAKLVERDPTLAARFLGLANSPLYSQGSRVVSAHAALVRLGLATARDLLLQVVYERSKAGLSRYTVEVEQCFGRSVLCALATVEVARAQSFIFADAYLCGLLHDIGEARIYRVLAGIEGAHPPDVVKRLVDRHHVRAGVEVARGWGLPEPVIDACENHHKSPRTVSPRVRVVMTADVIAAAASAVRAGDTATAKPTFSKEQQTQLDALGVDAKLGAAILQGVFVAGRISR